MDTVDDLVAPAPQTLWDQISSWQGGSTPPSPAVNDANLIDIVKKYGLGAVSLLPPATAAYLQQKLVPVEGDPFAGEPQETDAPKLNALKSFWGTITGSGTPTVNETKAPPLSAYPTVDDLVYAREQGFGYGTGNEAFIQGDVARVMGDTNKYLEKVPHPTKKNTSEIVERETFQPRSAEGQSPTAAVASALDDTRSRSLDLKKPENAAIAKKADTILGRAALAVNRDAIAALGFDPHRTVLDTEIKDANLGGAYHPKLDAIYANTSEADPSSVVHESIHRGIQRLKTLYPAETDAILKRLPREETVVRWLMHSAMGDPEKADPGKINQQQRQSGIDFFTHPGLRGKENQPILDQLRELAIRARKEQRPGGPR